MTITDTFFYKKDIVCITRSSDKNDLYVYGEYCTGKYNDGQEYAFPKTDVDAAVAIHNVPFCLSKA